MPYRLRLSLLAALLLVGAAWTVMPAGAEPPDCSFWESTHVTMAGNPIDFQDTSSDPDGDVIVVEQWDFGDGSGDSGPMVSHTYTAPGSYLVCLLVCDTASECSTCCETKTISAGGEVPVCLIWESTHNAKVGTTIVFDGGASFDPDGGAILIWDWDFGDGDLDSGPLVSHSYMTTGVYNVTLTVIDDQNEVSLCTEPKSIYDVLMPAPEFIRPIDEAWWDVPPEPCYPPVLTGDNPPFDNMVTLYVTEANGRESTMKPDGTGDIMGCRFEYSLDMGMTWHPTMPENYDPDGTTRTMSGAVPGDPPPSEPAYNIWSVKWDLNEINAVDPTFDEGYVMVRVVMTDYDGFPAESFFDVYCDLTPPKPDSVEPSWPEATGDDYQVYDEGTTIPLICHTYDQNVEEIEWYWQPIAAAYKKGVPLMNQSNPAWPTWCPNDGAMWCAPTANASCLKWWSQNGFPWVWPAARPDWVNRWLLARFMGTSCFDGTTVANQIRGTRNWIRAHRPLGARGLVVSGPFRATPQRFIRELANCREDVLLYWWWGDDPTDGGHEVTGNSFVTRRNADGTWSIDYMDPCGGAIVRTKMNAAGMIEVPPGSGMWYQAWMKTISPQRPPWPPFPPGEPWWPSCEVPYPTACDIVYTEWDLLDSSEWSNPETPVPAGLYLLKCQAIQQETVNPETGVPERYMMSQTTIVEIRNTEPTCNITYEPPMPMVMEPVQFHANAWDGGNPDGLGLGYLWDFGDAGFDPGSDPFHEFVAEGDYLVTCTVTDDEGSTGACTDVVHVQLQPEPPRPQLLHPIDPVWVDRRPPLTGDVTLRCTEQTGRTGWDDPGGTGDIMWVEFDYSLDSGMTWVPIGTDTTSATDTEGPDTPTPAYTWWSQDWVLNMIGPPELEGPVLVRARMTDTNGQTGEDTIQVWVDITPPQPEIIEPVVPTPEVIPEYPEGTIIQLHSHTWDENVIRVDWWWQPKLEWYVKGVPLLNQHDYGAGCPNDGNMYCAPTAWASCLKWWDANGYPNLVPAGMTDAQLVSGLATAMSTTCYGGTTVNNQVSGGRNWIANHGGGLHVTGPSAVTPKGIRNELENCKEDVLFGIYWNTGGGHRVTANSFLNIFDVFWTIDFMNPSNGLIESVQMKPNGDIEYPPGSDSWHTTGNMITVSPDIPRQPWWPSCEVEPPVPGPYYAPCTILYTEWDLNNPLEWEDPSIPMAGNRLYMLRCDMWDDTNHMMDDTIVFKILDTPPTCAVTHQPEPALVGDPVHFDSNAWDAGNPGQIGLICDWDFGDGDIGTGCTTSHTYMTTGVYTATCTVTDDEGSVAVCRDTVTVGSADCTVVCRGTVCGGPGPRRYAYEITAPAGRAFDHWHMGVHDMNPAHYTNWVLPSGWMVLGFFDASLFQHDDFTGHGGISTPTGMCPHHIAFGGPPISTGIFAFDHPGRPHDVGWLVECVGADCPGPLSCNEDWTQPVGLGLGPVHSPIPAAPPVPDPLEPIDPAWLVARPPVTGLVPLFCKEETGRTGTDDAEGNGDIAQVTFEYAPSMNGPWTLIGTDTTGETETSGHVSSPPQYTWWRVDWNVDDAAVDEGPYVVRVTMEDIYGQFGESFFDVYLDPTPPKPEIIHPSEYMVFPEGTVIDLIVHTWDEDVVEVNWWWQDKQDYYVKGVDQLNQHDYGYTDAHCPRHPDGCPNDGNMWCAPTASASCLEWWAANGYPELEAGLSKPDMVEKLAMLMHTDCERGTTGPGQADGLREYIKDHGGGLHVTGPSPVTARGLRNELENCKEDVLFWLGVPDLWWHAVTLNSFKNVPVADDTWEVDYMDPDDASIQWTQMHGNGDIRDIDGTWVNTCNMITVSPDVPRQPWWPSCTVPEPYVPCQDLITTWDLNDPDEWPDPTTPIEPGLKLLKCRMTDASGHVMYETIVIEILNLPPMCAISYTPANPQVGDTVDFDANASDPGGGGVTCSWSFGDGGGGGGCVTSHVYTVDGTYNVTVTVTDDNGASTVCTAVVVVAPATCRVVCNCSNVGPPYTYSYQVTAPAVPAGSTFDSFEVGTHDPVVANYTIVALPAGWNLVNIVCDSPWNLFQDNGYTPHGNLSAPTGMCCYHMLFAGPPIPNGVFKYTNPNPPHDVGWQVASSLGPVPPFPCKENWAMPVGMGQGPIHAPVYEEDLPPVCDPIRWSPFPDIWVGNPVTFSCCACDPDGGPVTATWDFGDGTPIVVGNPVNHTYAAAGCYTVKVTVTDDEGNTTTCTATIEAACMRVVCDGTACGGAGPTQYRYEASCDPVSVISSFWVGTDDPNLGNYSNWDLPAGWVVDIIEVPADWAGVFQHDDFHAHGVVSAPTGLCRYEIVFTTIADPPNPINNGVFGYDHDGEPHDVTWVAHPVPPGTPCIANWLCPVGTGVGPVHSPAWQDLQPVCNITYAPADPWVSQPVQFHANASDPDGGPVACVWDFGDGGGVNGDCDPVYTYANPGCYTVTVTVSDDEGNVVVCTAAIQVACVRVVCQGTACGGPGPSIYQYKVTAAPGNTFDTFELGTHDLVTTNYANVVVPLGWSLVGIYCDEPWPLFRDDGYTPHGNLSAPTGNCPGHILFAGPAINTGLFGFDNNNRPHDTGWLVSSAVGPGPCGENWGCPVGTGLGPIHAPVYQPDQLPACDVQWSPYPDIWVGKIVTFYSCAYDPDGGPVTCAWTFGDGGALNGNPVQYTYAAPGCYTVTVTVTDNEGSSSTCSAQVSVYCVKVICDGAACGGTGGTDPSGPRQYWYEVTAAPGELFDHWKVGTDDPDTANYSNIVVPPGWSFVGIADIYPRHDDFTAHGGISTPTGQCPKMIVFGGPPIASGGFGFDHHGKPHDVGWTVECVSGDCPTSLYCMEDWACPVGMGLGPVHGPKPTNLPPECCFTYEPAAPDDQTTVQFFDCSTDPDGNVVVWDWDFGDGTSSNEQNPGHLFAAGTYEVCLTVTDDGTPPLSDTCCQTITVIHINLPPICSFSYAPPNPDDKTVVQFTDTSSDPDGNVVGWSWDFGDGGNSNQQNPTHMFAAGTWNVCLTVTDDATPPASTTCCQMITVVAAPCKVLCTDAGCTPSGVYSYWAAAPTGHMFDYFEVGTDDPDPGNYTNWVEPVGWMHGIQPIQGPHDGCTPHGGVSMPSGTCGWRVVWMGPPVPSGAFGFNHKGAPHDVGWMLALSGTWRCIEDWLQPVGMGLGPVHGPKLFENLPPVCDITWEPLVPGPGTPVQFHANASDPDGGTVTCAWDFGDGGTAGDCDPVHSYGAVGDYNVCVTVTDDEGTSTTCCEVITVAPQLCLTLKASCWHMITLPCHAINPDPWEVFDELRPPNKPVDLLSGSLHRYDHDLKTYVTYYNWAPSAFGPIRPGDGYWLYLFPTDSGTQTICYEVDCPGVPEALYFPTKGWYMIGSPQPADTYIDDTAWYQGPTGPLPFSMIMDLWVQDPLIGYSCELTRYTYMGLKGTDEDDHLRAFQGYWMYTFEDDVTLVVPPPP